MRCRCTVGFTGGTFLCGDVGSIERLSAKRFERYYIAVAEIEQRLVSKLDGTAKYLLRLPDGEHVECVLMEYHHGYSICISSQVGCK